ncbi:MAG: 30S ribosomal protein S17 [Patescibacteria group bacterium]
MKKRLTGTIKSDKMIGTASVTVTRLKTHPLYLKRTRRTKTFLADNALGAKEGDVVVMESTRPLSRAKSWKIISIKKA